MITEVHNPALGKLLSENDVMLVIFNVSCIGGTSLAISNFECSALLVYLLYYLFYWDNNLELNIKDK